MFVHLPAFFIGFMLAPMAKEEKCISFLWMIVVPLFLVIMMKYLHFGYWPGFGYHCWNSVGLLRE